MESYNALYRTKHNDRRTHKKAQDYVGNEPFLLTYGDGVSDVNIANVVEFHKKSGKLMTMTSVQPSGRFGALNITADNTIASFKEKPKGDGAWINGGFFVCQPEVFDFIEADNPKEIFERRPLENIANAGQLCAYKHDGFWRPMDTLRDKIELDEMDLTKAESKATYAEIKDYVLEKYNLKVSQLYIAQVKRKHGIIERINYNVGESKAKVPQVPLEKEKAIEDALRYFQMI